MINKLSTMIVGYGNISSSYDPKMGIFYPYQNHSEVLKKNPNFELTAIIDKSKLARSKASKTWKSSIICKTLEELPKDYVPDVAVICTGAEWRHEILKKLKVRKAILLEKPIGRNLEDTKKIFNICKKLDVLVQVNLLRRADKTKFLQKKEILHYLGKIQFINVVYGNGIKNNGIHVIDFLRSLLGEVISVQSLSDLKRFDSKRHFDDFNVTCKIKFKKNVIAMMHPINFNLYRDILIDLWGEKGRIEIFQEGLYFRKSIIREHRAIENYNEISIDKAKIFKTSLGTGYYDIYQNLYNAIIKKEKLVSPLENALKNEIVIYSIIRSAFHKNKKVVI